VKQEIIFRKDIAVGQKTSSSGAYGDGYNYLIEAGFPMGSDHGECLSHFLAALAKIDHKALGIDVDLGFEPTSQALCEFLMRELSSSGATSLRMLRGDGLVCSI
jgi:hypothetical protein